MLVKPGREKKREVCKPRGGAGGGWFAFTTRENPGGRTTYLSWHAPMFLLVRETPAMETKQKSNEEGNTRIVSFRHEAEGAGFMENYALNWGPVSHEMGLLRSNRRRQEKDKNEVQKGAAGQGKCRHALILRTKEN